MSEQHTPGPWHAEFGLTVGSPANVFAEPDFIGGDKIRRLIARVYDASLYDAPDTREANARLIAAAPELLEQRNELLAEAKRLVALIEDWPSIHKEGDYPHGGALIGIRAAIERAEKGQP